LRLRHNAFNVRQMSIPRCWSMRESKDLRDLRRLRRYLILEDQFKQMQTEFNEKKDKIKEMIPSEEDFHQQDV
jgi:hypothetical protein